MVSRQKTFSYQIHNINGIIYIPVPSAVRKTAFLVCGSQYHKNTVMEMHSEFHTLKPETMLRYIIVTLIIF